MNRTHRARRERRRAALLGLSLSFLVHAAVFAFVRIQVPALPERSRMILEFEEANPVELERAIEIVTIRPDARAPASQSTESASDRDAAAAPSFAAGLPAAPAPRPLPGAPLFAAAVSSAELTYDQLVVLDPLQNVQAEPVAITDLPAAEPTPAEGVAPDAVVVHEPGSIGKAKRQWASAGAGNADSGAGKSWSIGFGGGGGHCPMPGRGGKRPGPFRQAAM